MQEHLHEQGASADGENGAPSQLTEAEERQQRAEKKAAWRKARLAGLQFVGAGASTSWFATDVDEMF